MDTETGRVWEFVTFVDQEGEPHVWKLIPRIDTGADMLSWLATQTQKPKPAPPTPNQAVIDMLRSGMAPAAVAFAIRSRPPANYSLTVKDSEAFAAAGASSDAIDAMRERTAK